MSEPTRIGKYTIESVLGKGAMGVVYKAFDPGIERVVAIKTVRKDRVDQDLIEQSMARFKNEAKAAGRLLHPNIVSVYEYGEDEANAFIVMEYVEGTGLRDYLSRKASFDLPHVASIMTQLLRALDFAHERGVIHRDIKPANLILTADGTLKVADFGIARIDTSNLTTLGMVMGTPSYMSPEQCQGQAVDKRSDLFSAAVVLYELLAGEKPFAGATETIAYKICHENPRPASSVSRLALSPTIDAVLAVALEKSPEARFQNARAFNRALREALNAPVPQNPDETAATQINPASVSMQPSVAAPPAWEDTILRTVERQLAHYVGPMARVMTRKAATQTTDLAQLYALLAENISDPSTRERFAAGIRSAVAPDATSPGAIATGTGTGTGTGTQSQVRPALEQSFVDQTSSRLAVYLGPIAKVVASRAAQKANSRQEFVRLVAGHLGAQERSAFLKEIGFEEG
ncbi:MAG: serine/threonine-protein kinase [Casimicrobiaceae bacterium]